MQTDAPRVERDLDAVHTDQEGARSWMAGVCGPHELKVHSSRALGFRHSGTVLKSMATTLGYVEYGVDVSVRVHNSDPLNCFSVSLPVVGEQELTLEGGRIRSDRDMGTILLPSAPQELVIAGNCRKILVAITKPAIAGVLGDLLQRKLDKPVVFQPGIDAANGDTASWWRMVKYLLTETENGGSLYRDSLFTSDIETALIKGLLLAQPHNYSDELKAARAAKLPHYLLRAKEFILETARDEVPRRRGTGFGRVALQALRGLQAAFRHVAAGFSQEIPARGGAPQHSAQRFTFEHFGYCDGLGVLASRALFH